MPTNFSASSSSTRVLFLELNDPVRKFLKQFPVQSFSQLILMLEYVSQNLIHADKFILVIPHDQLSVVLDDPVFQYSQVKHVYVYCDDASDLNEYLTEYIEKDKIRFCHERNVNSLLIKLTSDDVIDSSQSNYMSVLKGVTSSLKETIAQKRSNGIDDSLSQSKRFHTNTRNDAPEQNANDHISDFACPFCTIVSRQLYQLRCGHPICMSCFADCNQNINCPICWVVSLNVEIRSDRRFEKDIQSFPAWCTLCPWTGTHQDILDHIDQQHADPVIQQANLNQNDQTLTSDVVHADDHGSYVWTIANFQEKLNQQQPFVDSPAFYSSPNGYKICVRFYPNGNANVRDKYVSVSLVVLKGDYDDLLQWPFPYSITVRLIDQNNETNHIVNSFRPVVNSRACQKPITDMNPPFGLEAWIPCGHFRQNMNRFVKDDMIAIEIQMILPNASTDNSPAIRQMPNDGEHTVTHQ